ncbi:MULTISPECIES: bifunctional diguanylate cyclase/phosphodiesterase [Nocardiaceae]|uniref:bifunctional diguanylate cyclase/phosphodiesterase n=1 Tax=Nocardiaceae TaxID=85025 RepID=UPI00056807DA|nr:MULTISPECIES: bifunctional diguanylate cyclase/phosphodiesterase [Rhodococcus]OZF03508.1 bifunctional diguanylate cyclase/phosphodiesterase [Rhodococcus sp. 15-1189-1-1a]OZF17311.1 bifunctional diguanylate cyclase/phosphodiesterase [Rhodococcus sp. 14-2686-1-2]OZF54854.1 bifunctional diguanylate cyclase/phosphodiesterase [Rhodococcus sp. 14-2470-1b]
MEGVAESSSGSQTARSHARVPIRYGLNTYEADVPVAEAPEGESWGRRLIGLLTACFGLAGLLMIPSGQFDTVQSVMVALASASTVPVALAWFLGRWPSRKTANAYVLWADTGIVFVLLSHESPFVAMPGCVMFSIVALFGIVGTSPRVLTAHLTFATVVLLFLAVMAVRHGAEPWSVASRAVTIGSLFITPFALRPYIRFLRQRAQVGLRDSLTGLWNRRGLFDMVDQLNYARAGTKVESRAIGVVVVDIDRFKAINDRYGHPTGDAVLVEVADRLQQAASAGRGAGRNDPSTDSVVSRLGGDEFVCVHIGTRTEVDDAEQRVRSALEQSFSGPPFTTSVGSAGDTIIRGDATGTLVRKLIALADIELYRNKQDNFDGDPRRSHDPLLVRDRVENLIADGGPTVVFQPICDTVTTAVVGYEALSRFPFGHGSPLMWFKDATAAGVGPQLELAAIDGALNTMHVLPESAFLSLNASASTIRSTDLLARLRPHIHSRVLYLEITEHERVEDYRAIARSVEGLRAAGVRISIDDVGAGFSGLRQVVELKPDTLKIDYTLVHGIDSDPTRRAAAAALASFAHEVGATLIMEGVETEEELRVAVELDVDMVQGFYTGRPVTS